MARQTIADNDREMFAGYVAEQLTAWETFNAGGNTHIWDTRKIAAADRRHYPRPEDTTDQGAWAGPWHNVRPFLTTEFVDYMQGGYTETRQTFSQWRARAAAERDAVTYERAQYEESAEYATDQLADIRDTNRRRDALIVTAWERGASMRDLQESTGMSRSQLSAIRATYERGVLHAVHAAEKALRDAAELTERDAAIDAGDLF
jgi:hypothetical protein